MGAPVGAKQEGLDKWVVRRIQRDVYPAGRYGRNRFRLHVSGLIAAEKTAIPARTRGRDQPS